MEKAAEPNYSKRNERKPECEKCFGLCCIALYFSIHDGFPADKNAGTPCLHLDENFRCSVHKKLDIMGLRGCTAYDCLGAGQQVSQDTFAGHDWKSEPQTADLMFEVFSIMRQLYEMCWYLNEALQIKSAEIFHDEIFDALLETENATQLPPHSLMEFNLSEHGTKIYALLEQISNLVRNKYSHTEINKPKKPKDYFGKDLRKKDMKYADLRGACLIAANLEGVDLTGADLTGADLRDSNLKGANLSESIFLTQFQINAARGSSDTRLSSSLSRPRHWI